MKIKNKRILLNVTREIDFSLSVGYLIKFLGGTTIKIDYKNTFDLTNIVFFFTLPDSVLISMGKVRRFVRLK